MANSDMASDGAMDMGAPDPELAGRYLVTVDSPMGTHQTEVELRVDGAHLEGSLELAGNTLELQNGVAGTNGFCGEGHLKIMMMKIGATVRGRREGNIITGAIESSMGTFAFEGVRL